MINLVVLSGVVDGIFGGQGEGFVKGVRVFRSQPQPEIVPGILLVRLVKDDGRIGDDESLVGGQMPDVVLHFQNPLARNDEVKEEPFPDFGAVKM